MDVIGNNCKVFEICLSVYGFSLTLNLWGAKCKNLDFVCKRGHNHSHISVSVLLCCLSVLLFCYGFSFVIFLFCFCPIPHFDFVSHCLLLLHSAFVQNQC